MRDRQRCSDVAAGDCRHTLWAGFVRRFAVTFCSALALALLFAVAMNPFGNLPLQPFAHAIMDTSDRYQYPAIVRSGTFDSIVVGTSSSKLLAPSWLERAFGGRFANLGLNDGRAWEQYQLTRLFLRTVPRPRMILFGLDWVWCAGDAHVVRVSPSRDFPHWVYDDDPWNDWLYVLNLRGLENAAKQLVHRTGLLQARVPGNGFDAFVPPEGAYDATRASGHIWRGRARPTAPTASTYVPSDADRTRWSYPALQWLGELAAAAPATTRLVFAFMPAHVAAQPQPGTEEAAREAECKARIAAIADTHGAALIDFKIVSSITGDDRNYWDALHYRLPVAERIVQGIAKAVATRMDDPGGDWRYVAQPSP